MSVQAKAQKKLDEKHEKILREEANKVENEECFNCLQKGPFSIVLNFGIFVCNDCSGIHRSNPFNHRVKSINTSSFKPEEIQSVLNAGGNSNVAKEWYGQLLSQGKQIPKPLPGNEARIRDFMLQTFINRRFYLPPGKLQPKPQSQSQPQSQPQIQVPASLPSTSSQTFFQSSQPTSFSTNGSSMPSSSNFFEMQSTEVKANAVQAKKQPVDLFSFESPSPSPPPTSEKQSSPLVDLLGFNTPSKTPSPTSPSNSFSSSTTGNSLFSLETNTQANGNSFFNHPQPQHQQLSPPMSSQSSPVNDLFSLDLSTPTIPQSQFPQSMMQQQPFGMPQMNQQYGMQQPMMQQQMNQSPFFPQQQQYGMQQMNQQQPFGMQQPMMQQPMMNQSPFFPQQQQYGMQQMNQQYGMQQPMMQPTTQQLPVPSMPSVEQLNAMQNQFMQSLKTMPPNQAQSLSAQYQQMNQQQRMQFLIQNFGPKNNLSSNSSDKQPTSNSPPPGKFANAEEFRDLDVLSGFK